MKHPYDKAPSYTKWRQSVSQRRPADVDPVVRFPFKIGKQDRIATAGSCFAQHIARALSSSGFNYYVAEPGHPFLGEVNAAFGYGMFSARYGNIYTTRQLRQLIERAYGIFSPRVKHWLGEDGRYFDPFRPTIQAGGFHSYQELAADVRQHLSAVRSMLENMDYFVFTLGLTECWTSAADGAAYPLCPGVAAGSFNPEHHHFINFDVDDVSDDLSRSISLIRSVNPKAKIILTVSPVALAATAEDRHVIVSTTYSKAVLRIAAERASKTIPSVAYFPSYEIITSPFNRTAYLADDLREVNQSGVDHVMRLFMEHATDDRRGEPDEVPLSHGLDPNASIANAAKALQVECDEILLAR